MTPVFILTDGYIANGAEPWNVPEVDTLPQINVPHPIAKENGEAFMPYARDERLARPWALPGTPGLMHRIGGLEKQDITGNVNYEPANHEHMVNLRARKVALRGRRHSAASGRRASQRQTVGDELGRHLRRLCHRRAERRKPGAARSRTFICAI